MTTYSLFGLHLVTLWTVEGKLQEGFVIFADSTGKDAGGGHVIPSDVLASSQRPDIVVLDRSNRKVFILELTCPHDTNIATAHDFKMGKYASLVNDLVALGYKVDLFAARFQRPTELVLSHFF